MNGSAGSSRPKKQKQEVAGSKGAVPASKMESGDPVVGLVVLIVEIIAIRHKGFYVASLGGVSAAGSKQSRGRH